MNLFDEQYRAHVTPLTLAESPRSTPLITVEELRRATRPSTLLGLDPIFRNTGVDFRNGARLDHRDQPQHCKPLNG